MVTVRRLAIFGLAILAAARAAAQSGDDAGWTTAGPENAAVSVLAVDPTNSLRLFAGTELGVFRTDDGAETWTSTPARPTGILALAFDPANPDRLWVGSPGGTFESTDGGASFVLRNSAGPIRALAVDPIDSSVVYAAGDGETISKSSDGGATWTASFMSSAVAEHRRAGHRPGRPKSRPCRSLRWRLLILRLRHSASPRKLRRGKDVDDRSEGSETTDTASEQSRWFSIRGRTASCTQAGGTRSTGPATAGRAGGRVRSFPSAPWSPPWPSISMRPKRSMPERIGARSGAPMRASTGSFSAARPTFP